jgi:2-iminobutanoate/2-iminopropanoate deaminase
MGAFVELSFDNPAGAPQPLGQYSQVARLDLGNGVALLTLAGQVALDDSGNGVAPGDVGAQAERVFEIIKALLAAHGGGFADVMHLRVFVTDMGGRAAYAAARKHAMGEHDPASTLVEISRLAIPGLVLEVEATAAVRTGAG